MAEITDPKVIKFSNEYIRPMAEKLRDLKITMDEASAVYQLEVSGIMSANAPTDIIQDGRAPSGVSVLTKADFQAIASILNSLINELDQPGVMDSVRKPCVRAVRV